MGEVAEAYAGCRERISALTAHLDDDAAARAVPACPAWSVHDVVAHVAGVVDDALAGRLDGVATDPWTAAQVERRRGVPVAAILETWSEQAPAFENLLDSIGPPGHQAVADIVTHEHDIRLALGQPGARDSDAVRIGLGFVVQGFAGAAARNGTPVLVVCDGEHLSGDDDAPVALHGSAFDLLRAMTGRRSLEQLRAMTWQGEVDPVLPAFTFGPFRPATVALDE